MSTLFWSGDERADDLMSEASLLRAMVRVESAWLHALAASGIAGAGAADDLVGLVTDQPWRSPRSCSLAHWCFDWSSGSRCGCWHLSWVR